VEHGHELVVQPMRPVDALGPFTAQGLPDPDPLGADGTAGTDPLPPLASTLVLGAADPADADATPLAAVAESAGIAAIDVPAPDRLVLDDFALARLLARRDADVAAMVRIEGPVEAADAEWIERGLASDVPPLSTELRTVRSIQVRPNRTLLVHVRHPRDAMRFVAETMRHFLAAVAGLPLEHVGPPDVGLLVPLYEPSGEMAVRPIETDVYSTSVDVGVATSPPESPRPADASLIYDLHGGSWHGE
jgi:hypothetical protein